MLRLSNWPFAYFVAIAASASGCVEESELLATCAPRGTAADYCDAVYGDSASFSVGKDCPVQLEDELLEAGTDPCDTFGSSLTAFGICQANDEILSRFFIRTDGSTLHYDPVTGELLYVQWSGHVIAGCFEAPFPGLVHCVGVAGTCTPANSVVPL